MLKTLALLCLSLLLSIVSTPVWSEEVPSSYALQLTSGKTYRYVSFYAVTADKIKIVEPNGQTQIIVVNQISKMVTPKNHLTFVVNGMLWGGAIGSASYAFGISGTNALLGSTGIPASIGFSMDHFLMSGVTGALVGGGLGGALSLIMPDDENDFEKMTSREKMDLINRLQKPPQKSEKPAFHKSRWNFLAYYGFDKTLVANRVGGNDYHWQSSGTPGFGLEYENFLNENWSYGLGGSNAIRSVNTETVYTNGTQTAQTTFSGQKPEHHDFTLWLNFYYYASSKFYFSGGVFGLGYAFKSGPNGRSITTSSSWNYQLGLGYEISERIRVEAQYQWANGFEVKDQSLGQTGLGTTQGLKMHLKYTL